MVRRDSNTDAILKGWNLVSCDQVMGVIRTLFPPVAWRSLLITSERSLCKPQWSSIYLLILQPEGDKQTEYDYFCFEKIVNVVSMHIHALVHPHLSFGEAVEYFYDS